MLQGNKSRYTDKQERQATHIEKGYEKKDFSTKNAEERDQDTRNKITGDTKNGCGRKKN